MSANTQVCGLVEIVRVLESIPDNPDTFIVKVVGAGMVELLDALKTQTQSLDRLRAAVIHWGRGGGGGQDAEVPARQVFPDDFSSHPLDRLVKTLSDTLENDPIGFEAVPHAILPAILGTGIQEIRQVLLRNAAAVEELVAIVDLALTDPAALSEDATV